MQNIDPLYDFSDPQKVGRGAWYVFMIMAAHSESVADRRWNCQIIRNFCQFFKCHQCHQHAIQYLSDNPPEKSIRNRDRHFDWVVQFMNSVQNRMGKPQYDPDILLRICTQEDYGVCMQDCGEKQEPKTETSPTLDDYSLIEKILPGLFTPEPSPSLFRPASKTRAYKMPGI